MDEGSLTYKVVSGLVGVALGITGAWQYFRRSFSADSVAMARNEAEVNILNILQEQARVAQDRAYKAEHERTEALIEVGKLQGQLTILSDRMTTMQAELVATKSELSAARTEIHELNTLLRKHMSAVQ